MRATLAPLQTLLLSDDSRVGKLCVFFEDEIERGLGRRRTAKDWLSYLFGRCLITGSLYQYYPDNVRVRGGGAGGFWCHSDGGAAVLGENDLSFAADDAREWDVKPSPFVPWDHVHEPQRRWAHVHVDGSAAIIQAATRGSRSRRRASLDAEARQQG